MDFDPAERERIGLALQRWNQVRNGFVRVRPTPLPPDPSNQTVAQIRRSGAWIVPRSTVATAHLMAPVYDRSNGHCIDRGVVAMIESAPQPLRSTSSTGGPDDGRHSSR